MSAPRYLDIEASTYIRRLVHTQSGIYLGASKDYLLQSRLLPLFSEYKLRNFDKLIEKIKKGDGTLKKKVVEALATNESFWFRDARVWKSIADLLLPHWADKIKKREPVHVWSAACSLGQEPYSLAMLLLEKAPALVGKIKIHASDFSEQNLTHANQARYHDIYMSHGLSGDFASYRSWFSQPDPGILKLKIKVTQQVKFFKHNLLQKRAPEVLHSLVLLRNVLMYFDDDIKHEVVSLISRTLNPGGILLIGATERLVNPHAHGLVLQASPHAQWYRKE